MAATITDVAKLAKVSKKTVSRVINNEDTVTENTRQKVLDAITRLNYVPSALATSLAKGRANCIGMLLPHLTWPLILDILRGVTDVVETSNYALTLYSMIRDEESVRKFTNRMVRAKQIDGLIVLTPPGMLEYLTELHSKGLPLVLIDDHGYNPAFSSVVTTNFDGGYAATKHLLDTGRQRIAFINGPKDYGCNRERLAGYTQALKDFGLIVNPNLIYEDGDYTDVGDRGSMGAIKSFLEQGVEFDAVFAANDIMAFGAMIALRQAGLQVPDDVAVVGFDNISATAYTNPTLTTIQQPFYEMGQTAARVLIDALNGNPLPDAPIEVPTSLIVRDSSSPKW
jgi:LacI family transcriptional regulator